MKGSGSKKKRAMMKRRPAAEPRKRGLDSWLETVKGDTYRAVSEVFAKAPGGREEAILEVAALAGQLCDDVSEALAERAFAQRDPRACTAGCCWCCYQMVTTSPPVVFFLTQAVAASGDEANALADDTRKAAVGVRGLGARDRLALRLACPLLAEDGTCAVYPVRPLACRGWNTYDAEACRQSVESPDQAPETQVHVPQVRIAHAVESGVVAALRAHHLAAEPVELIGALAIAIDEPKALSRWLRGKDVFADVRPAPEQAEAARWFARGGA